MAALAPKVAGSWNLHELLPKDMEFFIMLSSVSGIVGNRGQSNYASGNTYQDALAAYRVAKGLPATSLDLGNILSVGFIAENKDIFHANPLFSITQDGVREEELLAVIEYHVDGRNATSSTTRSQVPIGLITAANFKKRGVPEPSFMAHPLFTQLRTSTEASSALLDEDSSLTIQSLLESAESLDDAAAFITESIIKRLSNTLAIPVDDIDVAKPIHHYGVDSLVAMEFRNWFAKDMAADIPVLDIMGQGSIGTLSKKIAGVSTRIKVKKEEGVST